MASVQPEVKPATVVGTRSPKCTRCRNHGQINELKGHKNSCRWQDCTCDKCLIMAEKQKSTAARIALYRQQISTESHLIGDTIASTQHQLASYDTMSSAATPALSPSNASLPQSSRSPTPDYQSPIVAERRSVAAEIHSQNVRILLYLFPFHDAQTLSGLLEENRGNMFLTTLMLSKPIICQADDYVQRLNQTSIMHYQYGQEQRMADATRRRDIDAMYSPSALQTPASKHRTSTSPSLSHDSAYSSDSSSSVAMPINGRKRPHVLTSSPPAVSSPTVMSNSAPKSPRLSCTYCRLDVTPADRFCANCGKSRL